MSSKALYKFTAMASTVILIFIGIGLISFSAVSGWMLNRSVIIPDPNQGDFPDISREITEMNSRDLQQY